MPSCSILTTSLVEQIKSVALEHGFDRAETTPAVLPDGDRDAYSDWCANGLGAGLDYMIRDPDLRFALDRVHPGAKTVLTLGVSYFQGPFPEKPGPGYGRVARYAWGEDYHRVIGDRLTRLLLRINELTGVAAGFATAVDTKPVLERALARAAGVGFIGKNTMLIAPRRSGRFHVGSWIFLAEILLDLPLETPNPSDADTAGCGGCTRCLSACPTDAFERPYALRADKCIAYLTIENKGAIPAAMRPRLGDWLFGCDVCQDVCPFNARAIETRWPEFRADRGAGAWIALPEVLSISDQAQFVKKWGGSPLSRAKRRGLVRNACVAAGNSSDETLVPFLIPLLTDAEPIVRSHAAWAVNRLAPGTRTRRLLADRRARETDVAVQEELDAVIAGAEA